MLVKYIRRAASSRESKDALYLVLLQCLNYGLPLVTIPYLMTVLGATGFGYYSFAFAFASYFCFIIEFGFDLSATKRVISATNNTSKFNTEKIISATIYGKLIIAIISIIFFFLLAFAIPRIEIYRICILCNIPMIIGQTLTLTWYFQSLGKIRIISIITTISRLLILPTMFIVVRNENDYYLASLIQASTFFMSGFISLAYIIKRNPITLRKCSVLEIKNEFLEALPLFISKFATSLYTQLLTLILGFLSTPAVVGVYASADKIIRSVCFIFYMPISQAFFPKFAKEGDINPQLAKKDLFKMIKFFIISMLIVGITIFIFAPFISQILGKGYFDLYILLRILAVAPLIISIGGVVGQLGLVAMGNFDSKRKFRNVYIYAGIVSIICTFIFVPRLLSIGAALSMLITESFITIMMIKYAKKSVIFQ